MTRLTGWVKWIPLFLLAAYLPTIHVWYSAGYARSSTASFIEATRRLVLSEYQLRLNAGNRLKLLLPIALLCAILFAIGFRWRVPIPSLSSPAVPIT